MDRPAGASWASGRPAWWALDEVVRGVDPGRRLLGRAGCALVVSGAIAAS